MKETWQVRLGPSILNQKYGLLFHGARKNSRGAWIAGRDLPEHVRSYMNLTDHGGKSFSGDFHSMDEFLRVIHEQGTAIPQRGGGPGLAQTFLIEVDSPLPTPKRRTIPRGVPAIRNLQDLLNHFGAETPSGLNRRIYKDTASGASISVQTPDGKWHHNGQDWSKIRQIVAFTIQSIVEGSDAEVSSAPFVLPVTTAEVDHWIADMEEETDRLWHEAND